MNEGPDRSVGDYIRDMNEARKELADLKASTDFGSTREAYEQGIKDTMTGLIPLLCEASEALQDWLRVDFSDKFDGTTVVQAKNRIRLRGGAISYAARISQKLRQAAGEKV